MSGLEVVGSVRMTPIFVGKSPCYLLGPLAVLPAYKNNGIGRELVKVAVKSVAETGALAVLLVGDEPYYGALDFKKAEAKISFPGPVDPARILVKMFRDEQLEAVLGKVEFRDSVLV